MYSSKKTSTGRPIIFGEVLYDIFETEQVLGGAPFNVAWHLQGFALQPLLITRIGQDNEGQEIHQTMRQWEMDTHFLQQDDQHPTGQVHVSLPQGLPHFEIPTQQAYDYLDADQVLPELQQVDSALLYHGTLALRHTTSRTCLQAIAEKTKAPIFLDINLRSPWWQQDLVTAVVKNATWLKVNEDEMVVLSPHFKTASTTVREALLEDICQQYQLSMIIVTLGDQGAILKSPQQPLLEQAPPPIHVVDSVGAGDAFSAVCIAGLLHHWPPQLLLERALTFAAAICQIRGATTMDRNFYHQVTTFWSTSDGSEKTLRGSH